MPSFRYLEHINEPEKKWVERYIFSYAIPQDRRAALEKELNTLLVNAWQSARELIRSYESDEVKGDDATPAIGAGFYYWDSTEEPVDIEDYTVGIHRMSTNGPYRNN